MPPIPFPLCHWASSVFTGALLFNAPLQNTLVPTSAPGGGTPAFGRNSTAYVQDWENLLKLVKNAEARFQGARRVENLLAKPEDFSHASWTKASVTVTSGIADPLSGTSAFTLTATGANAEIYQTFAGLSTAQTRSSSVWMRRRTGTGQIHLYFGASSSDISGSLTGTWQRFAVHGAMAATSYFDIKIVTSGDAVDVWHPQLEETTGQSNTNPSEYVSVGVLSDPWHGANTDGVKYFSTKNGNTVAAFVVTEATGAAITPANGGSTLTCDSSGPFGLLIEEARLSYPDNGEAMSAWNKLRCTVTANNATAPNGLLTADTFNEDNTNNNFHQAWWITGSKGVSSLVVTGSMFFKKSGRDWVYFAIVDDTTGFADCYFNVNTGTVGTSSSGGGFSAQSARIEAYPNGWYRCIITCTTGTRNLIGYLVCSAEADNDNIPAIALNAAAFIGWGGVVELGAYATSYIPPGVSRPYDGCSFSTFAGNGNATNGTAYAETKTLWTTAAAVYPLLAFGIANLYPLYTNTGISTAISANDGTNNTSKSGIGDMNTAVRKVASSWTGAVVRVTGTGAAAASGTFDGNMGSTAIGFGTPTTGTGVVWNGTIRNVKLYSGAASAAQLQTLTT